MEIRVKTAAEFRDTHVTVEIRASQDEVVEVHQRLYTAAEVGDAQTSEAELVSAPLRRRVAELEAELDARDLVHGGLQRKIREHLQSIGARDRLLREATEKVRLYDVDRRTEHQRAERNQEWAERAEARLADAEAAIQTLSGQLGRISGAVHSPELVQAMNPMWQARETTVLREAVRQVRDALGSPSLPSSPVEPTSQA